MKSLLSIWTVLLLAINLFANTTIKINDDIQLIDLGDQFYLHQSMNTTDAGRYSANGLLVIKNNKAILIDTPASVADTKAIYNFVQDSLGAKISLFIGGHYHEDCIGGMSFLKEQGVECILGSKTKEKCIEFALPLPSKTFDDSLAIHFENCDLICSYFGGGHTLDNIVVYFPEKQLLFGGCLVKNMASTTMGNIADAVPDEWGNSIKKILARYTDLKIVIPGHGDYGDAKLLSHTLDLTTRYFTKQ